MANPEFVHVIVRNRAPTSMEPISLEARDEVVTVPPNGNATALLTWEQFLALHAQQRDAVRRAPGVLRMIDFWTSVDGARVEVEVPQD